MMANRTIRLGIPALAAALMLAGCGSGATPASQALASSRPATLAPTQAQATAAAVPTIAPTVAPTSAATAGSVGAAGADVCKLLTVAEVSAAIGSTVDLAVPNADDNYGYCDYKERGDNKVKVYVTRSATGAAYWDTVKINKGEVVPGIGDEAYWSADSFLPGLYFKKGGVLAYISGATYPEDGILDLGRLLASRM